MLLNLQTEPEHFEILPDLFHFPPQIMCRSDKINTPLLSEPVNVTAAVLACL